MHSYLTGEVSRDNLQEIPRMVNDRIMAQTPVALYSCLRLSSCPKIGRELGSFDSHVLSLKS